MSFEAEQEREQAAALAVAEPAPPPPDTVAAYRAAAARLTEARERYARAEAQMREAETAFAAAQQRHRETVTARSRGDAAADPVRTRGELGDAEDAHLGASIALQDARAALDQAEERMRPLAEAEADRQRREKVTELEREYLAAVERARQHGERFLDSVKTMEAALEAMATLGHDARRRANELSFRADGLPLVMGTIRRGQSVM